MTLKPVGLRVPHPHEFKEENRPEARDNPIPSGEHRPRQRVDLIGTERVPLVKMKTALPWPSSNRKCDLGVAVSGRKLVLVTLVLACLRLAFSRAPAQELVETIHSEGVPPIPAELDQELDLYRFYESVSFQGWLAGTRRVVYLLESNGIPQVFVRSDPDQPEQQLTSFRRPVAWVCPHPARERLVIALDQAGQENYQLLLSDQPTRALHTFTNSFWRNTGLLWSPRGHFLALTSNARNGTDRDLYIVKPPYATTGRRIRDAIGTCSAQDWSPDERRIVAVELRPDWTESCVELIDVATGTVEIIPQPIDQPVRRTAVRWSRDGGALYWLTNRDSEFLRLARYDLATEVETPLTRTFPGTSMSMISRATAIASFWSPMRMGSHGSTSSMRGRADLAPRPGSRVGRSRTSAFGRDPRSSRSPGAPHNRPQESTPTTW